MGRIQKNTMEYSCEDMRDLLEDVVTRIQEIREEFLSALDDIEDMITNP